MDSDRLYVLLAEILIKMGKNREYLHEPTAWVYLYSFYAIVLLKSTQKKLDIPAHKCTV